MQWIDIVGVRLHLLHSHDSPLINNVNPQVYSNPNPLVE